jgi:hypothetical protein
MTLRSYLVLIAATLSLGAVAAPAGAQPPPLDPGAADVLFREAVAALDKGDWVVACDKFNASMNLDPSVSTLINIAKCHDHEGKFAVAWVELNRALELNGDTADAQRKADLEKYTRSLIAAIEARVSKLKIVIQERPPGLRVTRDGVEVSLETLGVSQPVGAGTYEIEVSAPGYATQRHTVNLAEGRATTLDLTLMPSTPVPSVAKPAAARVEAPPPRTPMSVRRLGTFVAGGVGVVGVVVGAVAGGAMLAKKGTVSSECTNGPNGVALCKDSAGVDAGNNAKTLGAVSSVGWVTALVGIGVGTVLFVTEPRAAKPSRMRNGPWVSAGLLTASGSGASFGVEGGF